MNEDMDEPRFPALHLKGEPLDIFRAAAEGDLAAIRRYVQEGHSVNTSSLMEQTHGSTPLHAAVESRQAEAVQLLLDCGADANTTDLLDRWTPLHHAVFNEDAATVRLLLRAGAVVDILDYNEETALHHAALYGFAEGVRLLLEAGADPSLHSDYENNTPLHNTACSNVQSAACARLLLAAGAEVNEPGELNYRPLDWADHGNELWQVLREHGGRTRRELEGW